MTHKEPVSESDGKLTAQQTTTRKCPKCGGSMMHQTWESDDGAYEDSKYSCPCGFVRWVDGIDS